MSTNTAVPFRVVVDDFAEKHFIKDFKKKHKSHWLKTRKAIVAQFNNLDLLLDSGRLTPAIYISEDRQHAIYKHKFSVVGSGDSPKKSGNRTIIYVDYGLRTVRILLLYGKNHIDPPNETVKWKSIVTSQYPEIFQKF